MPFCPCYICVDLRSSLGLVLLLCWRESPGPDSQGNICPATGSRQRPPQGTRQTGHPACRQGQAGPDPMAALCRNVAHRWTRRRRTARTLWKHHRARPAQPSITTAPRPSVDRITRSNDKRLPGCSKSRISMLLWLVKGLIRAFSGFLSESFTALGRGLLRADTTGMGRSGVEGRLLSGHGVSRPDRGPGDGRRIVPRPAGGGSRASGQAVPGKPGVSGLGAGRGRPRGPRSASGSG
jgi:hypothetical protein